LLHNKVFLLSAYSLLHTPFLLYVPLLLRTASTVPDALYICPPFLPQTLACTWPPAFPPPLAPSRSSWPSNPLSPGRNCSLTPFLYPHLDDSIRIALSLRCTVIEVARRQRQETRPPHWPSQLQRQQAATMWHAQRIAGMKAWWISPCEGGSIRIQHTNLGTYNTLAEYMAEVGATVTTLGACHPHG
jgi:hypothetical protein